jgi:phosphoribosylanthranilate isomerase
MTAAYRVRVKICGLTNLDDAAHAWDCGADLLGFILVPASPRYVTPGQVAEIAAALRAQALARGVACPPLVGVMAEGEPEAIQRLVAESGVDVAQLHGVQATAELLAALHVPAIVVHQAPGTRVVPDAEAPGTSDAGASAVDWAAMRAIPAWAHLLDTHDPKLLGGTGRAWDWSLAAAGDTPTQTDDDRPERWLVAGGLTPDTVGEAVRLLRPWGVDVASGVEAAPGRKDHDAVARFITRARGASILENQEDLCR